MFRLLVIQRNVASTFTSRKRRISRRRLLSYQQTCARILQARKIYWFSLCPHGRFVKCSYLIIYGQHFSAETLPGRRNRRARAAVVPRTFIYFQRPNILRFRANNLRRRDLWAFVTEFSSLNRSIFANGADVNYFIIGSLSAKLYFCRKKCINARNVPTF